MSDLIELLGHTVESFASAEEFLASDRFCQISCLVTDVQMSGMSGVELQGLLLSKGYRNPVIFVTAFPHEAVRQRVLKDGAIGYLTKPLREESFIACLNKALSEPYANRNS